MANENKALKLGELKEILLRSKQDAAAAAAAAAGDVPVYTLTAQETPDSGFSATYQMKKDGVVIGDKIQLPITYTKTEIDGKLSSVYKPAGSVAFASLPTADAVVLGNVYNITDNFTTTAAFVEGAGKTHPAGTNVVVVSTGEDTYGYDVLAGFVDLSGCVQKEEGKGLSTEDYTTAEQTKLNGIAEGATKVEASTTAGNIKINGAETTVIEYATSEEVAAVLDEVFGTTE